MAVDREGVLGRWSRLKRETRRETGTDGADGAGVPPEAEARPPAAPPGPQGAEPPAEPPGMLTEADLPPIEELTYDSDFSVFLKENVPRHLQKLALRRLWRSDPLLACVDGLNDYDLDYTIKEAMTVAAESAEDLARGAKRLNISELRAQEREAVARRHSEEARAAARPGRAGPATPGGELPRTGAGEGEPDPAAAAPAPPGTARES